MQLALLHAYMPKLVFNFRVLFSFLMLFCMLQGFSLYFAQGKNM